MNILLVNTFLYPRGGDTTYTISLNTILTQHGHSVGFFGMQDERNLPIANQDLFVTPIDFRDINQRKTIKNGLMVLSRSIYSIEARQKFSKLLDRVKPDIVHIQNIHAHITPSIIFEAKVRRIPVIWTLHDYKLICPNSHFLIDSTGMLCEDCRCDHYYKAICNQCKKGSFMASLMASIEAYTHQIMGVRKLVDMFIAPSAFLRNKLVENGFPPEKVVHLPLFLREQQFEYSERDEGYFLFLGKIDTIKGIAVLAEAARQAPEIQVFMAGIAGDEQAKKLISNLPPNVFYLGMKSGEELKNLLQGARALVLPSLWYENQPFVILEAFAAGKPVIASDLGGMRELVAHGERGLLFKPGDARQLAQSLLEMKESVLYRQYCQNAFDYMKRSHSADNHYSRIFQIYQRCVDAECD